MPHLPAPALPLRSNESVVPVMSADSTEWGCAGYLAMKRQTVYLAHTEEEALAAIVHMRKVKDNYIGNFKWKGVTP